MYYFISGTDTAAGRAYAHKVVAALRKKRMSAEYFRVTSETWSQEEFEGFILGQGLFEQKCIVFADGLCERADVKEWLVAHAKDIKESENAFVLFDIKIDAVSKKVFEKYAYETKFFESVRKDNRKNEFNTFSLADALGNRDKVALWSLLSESFMRGTSSEAVGGVLFWQVKSMVVASDSKTVVESGLSPFVYSKSKRFAGNYSREELVRLSDALVSIFHDSHRGLIDGEVSLERLALSI